MQIIIINIASIHQCEIKDLQTIDWMDYLLMVYFERHHMTDIYVSHNL